MISTKVAMISRSEVVVLPISRAEEEFLSLRLSSFRMATILAANYN
jgi:hypothetical protein